MLSPTLVKLNMHVTYYISYHDDKNLKLFFYLKST
jgi:hypothetical protein